MRLALNMGTMAKEGFLHAVIEETQDLIKNRRAETQKDKQR